MNKTIGFFGDSFCAESYNHHSLFNGYKTYISLVAKHYNAKIVNLGHGGSSVWDAVLLQLTPLIEQNKVPDICVFVWSMPGRLFHRKVRRLNSGDALHPKLHTYNPFQKNVWSAAKEYYTYLHDQEFSDIQHEAALRYIDDVILPKIADKKIVHLWAAGKPEGWYLDRFRPSKTTYHHTWKHGSEIRPSLASLSLYDSDIDVLGNDHRTNHLDGKFKNETVFNWIKLAVDNPNSFWDYSKIIDRFYDKSPEEDPPAI